MRALRFSVFGGPEVLSVEDAPMPARGPGEVLVQVHAGGVNFADTERRRGLYLADQPLPETLGFEGAGVVVEADASEWMHRRVAFVAPRAHAEFVAVPVGKLIPLPDQLDFIHGAAFPVQALTAWHVLHTMGRVEKSDTVLVHSAAGGVGQLLVQLAKEVGATVIGTVSRQGKVPVVKALGADQVLIRGEDTLPKCSLVLEAIGPEALKTVCLENFGRWVNYGSASGELSKLEVAPFFERSATFAQFWLRTPMRREVELDAQAQIIERLISGRLTMNVSTAGFDDAARVHRRLEGGLTTGKWVLRVLPSP